MAESAALLVDDVLLGYPIRQWVLSLPIPLRLLLARYPSELSKAMQIIHRAISTHIVNKAGFSNNQSITCINGSSLPIQADTICIHGDSPSALDMSTKIRTVLDQTHS